MKNTSVKSLVPTFKSWVDDFWKLDNLFPNNFPELRNNWKPAVNIKEANKHYEIEMAAPGLRKEDFDIKIENGILCISAEREETKEEKEADFTRKEFSYNSFERSFSLPEDVDAGNITAKYSDGVLKLNLKKSKMKVEAGKKVTVS